MCAGLNDPLRIRFHRLIQPGTEMGNFDRFSAEARHCLVLASNESSFAGHTDIGTDHMLLAVISWAETLDSHAIQFESLTSDVIRSRLYSIRGNPAPHPGFVEPDPTMTPRCRSLLESSVGEADRKGMKTIEPEHFLLGMLQADDSLGIGLLKLIEVDLDTYRSQIEDHLSVRMAQSQNQNWLNSALATLGRIARG